MLQESKTKMGLLTLRQNVLCGCCNSITNVSLIMFLLLLDPKKKKEVFISVPVRPERGESEGSAAAMIVQPCHDITQKSCCAPL